MNSKRTRFGVLPTLLLAFTFTACGGANLTIEEISTEEIVTYDTLTARLSDKNLPKDLERKGGGASSNLDPIAIAEAIPSQESAYIYIWLRGSDSWDPNPEDQLAYYHWEVLTCTYDMFGTGCPVNYYQFLNEDSSDAHFMATKVGDYLIRLTVVDEHGQKDYAYVVVEIGDGEAAPEDPDNPEAPDGLDDPGEPEESFL